MAQDCLNEIESRITDEHYKFSYLANLCGKLRNKHELYRVWENYKSVFPKYSSDRYSSVIYYLFKMDDIEDAEKIYEEWLSQPDGSDSEDIIEELARGKGWVYLPSPKTVRYILKICVEESDGASQKALYQIFEEARISKSGVEYLVTPHLFL
ncbi:Hypothetical predicted protein [Olea europaea subsp. europaea]|uniref:Pentatricopeptide repeat-containing protein n=1 Tax=Olea europaea subsp. europaea TaxID=158383 RepID=A0A8S0QTM3_OLEEU|nr:Hypothetical predicted protein [Olea europaea subsp. europaea]